MWACIIEPTALALDYMRDDRKTEPGPSVRAAAPRSDAIETPRQVWDVLGIDSLTAVHDGEDRMAVVVPVDADVDIRSGAAILQRIVAEVAHELLELAAVAANRQRLHRLREPKSAEPTGPRYVSRGRLPQRAQNAVLTRKHDV